MKMMWAVVVLCSSTPVLAATEAFTIGDTTISFPVPKGYCRPEGQALATFQLLARADTINVTHLDLVPCTTKTVVGTDHIAVKTPKNVINVKIKRADLLAALKPSFDKPEFKAEIASKATALNGNLSKETGSTVEVGSDFGPRGIDGDCAYVAGTLKPTGAGDQPAVVSGAAACMSSVADKFVSVNFYSGDRSETGIRTLMGRARALMLTMRGQVAK